MHFGLAPARPEGAQPLDLLALGRGVDLEEGLPPGEQRGRLGLGEPIHTHHDLLAALDRLRARRLRLDQALLHVRALDGRHHPALAEHVLELQARGQLQLGRPGFDHARAVEEILVFEQIGLVGEDLLDAQRPLLVPGAREAQRLVPGRELERAAAGVLREGDAERFQHDPDHVVLGLRLGESQAVHLHAVAEAAQGLVEHVVALAADLVPELGHRAHLAHLLQEADARVQEEGDAAHDARERRNGNVAARLHGVEHGHRRRHRVGDLLHGRRAGLLEMVGADVDRIPFRERVDAVGHHVADQPHGRARREDVGAAREVLLDDVVLGGALQELGIGALALGHRHVEREQPGRGGVDRHRGVHAVERKPCEELRHVVDLPDRDAHFSDLTARERVIGVIPGLGGEIEGDREPRLALREVGAVELVAGLGGGVPGIGSEDPGAFGFGSARGRHPASHRK